VLDAGVREATDVLQPTGERVAAALELGEAEQPRTGARFELGSVRDRRREERGDRLRQLALQMRDLRTQRASRRVLVELLDGLGVAVDRQLLELGHASDSSW
jgi:hypothetical protein